MSISDLPRLQSNRRNLATSLILFSQRSLSRMMLLAIFFIPIACVMECQGHGRFLIPPSRSSMWRYKDTDPTLIPYKDIIQANYNDNELNCGGRDNQIKNGGRCGVCGDPYQAVVKENEAGGKYALGIITRYFTQGQMIKATFDITAQHRGYVEFRLCPWNNVTAPVTQECLNQYLLKFHDGSTKWYLPTEPDAAKGRHVVSITLPSDVVCQQCVIQWRYRTGNSWGSENGQGGLGLGQQEEFYGCSDVVITSSPIPTSISDTSTPESAKESTTITSAMLGTDGTDTTSASKATTLQDATLTTVNFETTVDTSPHTATSHDNCVSYPSSDLDCSAVGWGVSRCRSRDSFYFCAWSYQVDPFVYSCPSGTTCDPENGLCDHEYNVPRQCSRQVSTKV